MILLILLCVYLIGVIWLAIDTYGDYKFGRNLWTALLLGLLWPAVVIICIYEPYQRKR